MNREALNAALLEYTDSQYGLGSVAQRYAQAVGEAARVLGVSTTHPQVAGDVGEIALTVQSTQQPVTVGWTPAVGWYLTTAENVVRYRVSSEADAAGLVPAPETVAAWLRVLAAGDRSGHEEAPEEPAPDDPAVLALLVTCGAGTTHDAAE